MIKPTFEKIKDAIKMNLSRKEKLAETEKD